MEGDKAQLARSAALLISLFTLLCIYYVVYPEMKAPRDSPLSQESPILSKPRKVLHANPIQIDEFDGNLVVNWKAIVPKEMFPVPFVADHYLLAVYQNEGLVQELSDIIDYLDDTDHGLSTMAQYRIANTTARPIAILGDHTRDYFSASIKLEQVHRPFWWQGFTSIYPFDQWAGETTFVANLYDLARDWNLPGSFGISFEDAILVDNIFNWKLTLNTGNSCPITVGSQTRSNEANPCHMVVNFTARRTGTVIFSSLAVVVTNWFITVMIIIMTVRPHSFVSFRDDQYNPSIINTSKNINLFYIMAFTALYCTRASLPVSFTSGALIDIFGFFPNLIIAFSCVVLTIFSHLHKSVQDNPPATVSGPDIKSTNEIQSETKFTAY